MDHKFLDTERSPREMILFALVSFGVLLSIVSVIIASIPGTISGVLLTGMGLGGFWIKHWYGE